MSIRCARGGLTGLAALGLVLAGVLPASASSTPGWRITKVLPSADGLEDVAATSPGDAWAAGLASTNPATVSEIVVRWNGKAWRSLAVPARLQNQSVNVLELGDLAASSASNGWLFPEFVSASTGAFQQDAFRWDGRKWTSYKLAGAQTVTGLAFSATNVWALGQAITRKAVLLGPPYGARFNGRMWKRTPLPGDPRYVSASSADDIWMLGPTTKSAGGTHPVDILMHWDGRRWHTMRAPAIKADSGKRAEIDSIVALGPKNLLAIAVFPGSLSGEPGPPGVVIAHWNGRSWHTVAEDRAAYAQSWPASDGHGGLWMEVRNTSPQRLYLLHYTRGRLVLDKIPGKQGYVAALASIPGTTSEWAVAGVSDPAKSVILKYGR